MFEAIGVRPTGARSRWLTASASLVTHVAVPSALVMVPLMAVTTPAVANPVQVFLNAPALVTKVAPEYPAIARAAQLEGIVILEASVDDVTLQFHLKNGSVRGAA